MCISKDKGKCELIYKELKKPKNEIFANRYSGVTFTSKLSEYRKILKMKVVYIRHNERTVRFIK